MRAKAKPGQYRAKTLASAAGISTNLLRAWERRYVIFEPQRQPNGHRLYTEDDLTVLRQIKELTSSGLSIGEAVALGRKALLQRHQTVFSHNPVLSPLNPLDESLDKTICELAPRDLLPRRATRYGGEDLGVSLRSLHPHDLSVVYRLYRILKGLYEVWIYMEQRPVRSILLGRLKELFEPRFRSDLQVLGAATSATEPLLQSALQDARAGALNVLYDYCRPRELEQLGAVDLQVMLTLARDHAKMLRNSFYDLDSEVREADESLKAHPLQPILQKLRAFYSGRSEFQVGTNYEGPISCRCLETSALDRVTYRMLERCIDPQKPSGALWIVQVNEKLCRWAFQCSADRFKLPEEHDLTVQAVALAMGVSAEEVLSFAYLGAARRSGNLWAWFHWPVFQPPPEVPHCQCEPLGGFH